MMKRATAKIAISLASFYVADSDIFSDWVGSKLDWVDSKLDKMESKLYDKTIAKFSCVLRPIECTFPFKLDNSNRRYDSCLPAGYGGDEGKGHWCINKEKKRFPCSVTTNAKVCMNNLVKRERREDLKPESPVLMISGFLNSKLYVKKIDNVDTECAEYFPEGTRVWPIENKKKDIFLTTVLTLIQKKRRNCWIKMMTLEKKSDGNYAGPGEIKLTAQNTGLVNENVANLLNPLRDAFIEGAGYKEGPDGNFFNFAYDWRLSTEEFATNGVYLGMIDQIEKMFENGQKKPVTIIGFSYGAQVALGLLNYAQRKKGTVWMKKYVGNLISTVGAMMGTTDTFKFMHLPVKAMNPLVKPFLTYPGFQALIPQASHMIRKENESLFAYSPLLGKNMLKMGKYCTEAEEFLPFWKDRNLCTKASTLDDPAKKNAEKKEPLLYDILAQRLPEIQYGVYFFLNTGVPTTWGFNFSTNNGELKKEKVATIGGIVTTIKGDETVEEYTHYPGYMWKHDPDMRMNENHPERINMIMHINQDDTTHYPTDHKGGVLNAVILSNMVRIVTRKNGEDPQLMRSDDLDDFTKELYEKMDDRRRRAEEIENLNKFSEKIGEKIKKFPQNKDSQAVLKQQEVKNHRFLPSN